MARVLVQIPDPRRYVVRYYGAYSNRARGLFWHLRTPGCTLVVVQAGRLLLDTETSEIVKVTHNFNPDFAGVICSALGGPPAP